MALTLLQPEVLKAQSDPGGVAVTIERWDVDITINPNSTFTVREEQTLTFGADAVGTGARSVSGLTVDGILNVTVADEDGTPFTLVTTDDPDAPGEIGTYRLDLVGNTFRILWFFEPTSDETRTFVIQYDVFGPLVLEEDIDIRLVWDAIPPGHLYPVTESQVTVTLPEQTTLNTETSPPAAYGYAGEPELTIDGQMLRVAANGIRRGEGLRTELYFQLEDGYPLEEAYEQPEDEFEGANLWLFVIFVTMTVGIIVGVFVTVRLNPKTEST